MLTGTGQQIIYEVKFLNTNNMSTDNIEKIMTEEVNPVSDEVKNNLSEEQHQEQAAPMVDTQPAIVDNSGNLLQFSNIVVSLYQNASDLVFKAIKKKDAPEWDKMTTEAIKTSLENYLATLNVNISPLYTLIITVVTAEVMRYSVLDKLQEKITAGNE